MRIAIHRPKLLMAVLLVILGIGSVTVIWAEENGLPGVGPFAGSMPVSQQVVPDQKREATEIIEDSGIVERINGGQDWVASNGYAKDVGRTSVVRLHASWENPVVSSGTWVDVDCQGTRLIKISRQFTNVTRLTFYVDTEGDEVVGYAVSAHKSDEAGSVPADISNGTNIKVYDTETDALVYDGRYADLGVLCPDGFEAH